MVRCGLCRSVAAGLSILLLIPTGCVIHTGSWSQARYERTVSEQAPIGANTALDVESRFGSITITGTEADEFDVTATITGHAPTEEEARELAEETVIRLESVGNTLRVRADTPAVGNHRRVGVSYTIAAPKRIGVRCQSNYGSLHVTGIEGQVTGTSDNGSITVERIQGPLTMRTSYGSITCRDIIGQTTELKSSNGSITVDNLKGSLRAETSYGSITCNNVSDGDVHLRSNNGRVALARASADGCTASSSYGSVACTDLKATTAALSSGNGSLELADVEAQKLGLSTSYGAIRAEEITAAEITANSGNGSIHIACSPWCPGDVKIEIRGGYGGIDFTAPSAFAGRVRLSTSYGSIRTARPVTVSGQIDKKNITGTIGQGNGDIHLETSNGSIELK